MNTFALILSASAILCSSISAIAVEYKEGIPETFPRKKLIAVGWDSPSPATLLEHLEEIENTPFDGTRVQFEAQLHDGNEITFRRLFTSVKWQKEWFLEDVEILKKAKSSKLSDNFLSIGPGPAIDWYDDQAWAEVVEHFRIAAWVAKQGGLKGVIFDPELGSSRLPSFSYSRQQYKNEYTFSDYSRKIRQRGQEVMQAMASEYPDMTIFCLFLNGGQAYSPFFQLGGTGRRKHHFYVDGGRALPSGPTTPSEVQEQAAALESIEGGPYNMLPAFLNGWLDFLPPGMKIVDGLEQTYVRTKENEFLFWANHVRNYAIPLVAEENKAKYRSQVQVGFGIYLDAYVNPPGNKFYVGPEEGYNGPTEGPSLNRARMSRLEKVIGLASRISDEYVWTWGEKYRWWPTQFSRVGPQYWDEMAPGISKSLNHGMDPSSRFAASLEETYRRFSENHSPSTPSLLDHDGVEDDPSKYWTHVSNKDGGTGDLLYDRHTGRNQRGSLHFKNAPNSFFVREVPITGNQTYGIRLWSKQEGDAHAFVRIRWKIKGKPLTVNSDNIYLTPAPSGDDTWSKVEGIVVAPAGVDQMLIQLGMKGNTGNVWYNDIGVYNLK